MTSFDNALKAYNGNASFVAFDLETTGLDPVNDQIVEIGAIKFDRRGPIARFSVLVNPGIPMPAEAVKVNNITDEMLAGKDGIEKVLPDFLQFIDGSTVIAHNAPFDCGFINEKLKIIRAPYPSLPNPVIDTLAFSREKFPALKSHSLQNLAAALNISARDAHRAEDDARLCMELFKYCLNCDDKAA